MSLMFMVAAALGLLLAAIAVALVWSVMRGGGEERARAAAGDAPRLGDVVVFLRFDGAAARDAEALVSARAASALLDPPALREVAEALAPMVDRATHGYVGPAHWAPSEARVSVPGGRLIGLRARTRAPIDAAAMASTAPSISGLLRTLAGLPDASIIEGFFRTAEPSRDPRMPALAPLRAEAHPAAAGSARA